MTRALQHVTMCSRGRFSFSNYENPHHTPLPKSSRNNYNVSHSKWIIIFKNMENARLKIPRSFDVKVPPETVGNKTPSAAQNVKVRIFKQQRTRLLA